jgi:hypothetical protein
MKDKKHESIPLAMCLNCGAIFDPNIAASDGLNPKCPSCRKVKGWKTLWVLVE